MAKRDKTRTEGAPPLSIEPKSAVKSVEGAAGEPEPELVVWARELDEWAKLSRQSKERVGQCVPRF